MRRPGLIKATSLFVFVSNLLFPEPSLTLPDVLVSCRFQFMFIHANNEMCMSANYVGCGAARMWNSTNKDVINGVQTMMKKHI